MPIRTRWFVSAAVALAAATLATPLAAQQPTEQIDAAMNTKLRAEEADHSKIMWIEHELTDVYGPRPIGSPNHVAAANWAVKTMTSWGMKDAHLEPFTWRGVGWMPGLASGYIISPVKANIKFEAVPWSPSTKGTVKGQVVSIVAPETPTEDELIAYLAPLAAKVKGGIVMVGLPPNVPVNFNERAKRIPDDEARARVTPAAGPGAAGVAAGHSAGAAVEARRLRRPRATSRGSRSRSASTPFSATTRRRCASRRRARAGIRA